MSEYTSQIAKAAYVAMHRDKRWAESAWDDMGGSEPSDERARIEVAVQEALIEHAAQCTPEEKTMTREWAVQSRTHLDGEFDQLDDGSGWSHRYGRKYTEAEARDVARVRNSGGYEVVIARVVSRTVTDWKETP